MITSFDQEMLQDFVVEVMEHIESVERDCLAMEADGSTKDRVNGLFRAFHTIKGLAGFVDQHLIQRIAHAVEDMLEKHRKTEALVDSNTVDLVLEAADLLKALCADFTLVDNRFFNERINDWILKMEEDTVRHEAGIGRVETLATLARDNLSQEMGKRASAGRDEKGYIRVPAQKVDSLVDMLGELLILEAGVEQSAGETLVHNLSKMSRITKEMQNLAISMRMVSLKSTFQKLQRVARDASSQLEKSITIDVQGEETEIDRGVAEKLLEPLLHLVKNCVSHGLEESEERRAQGKALQGQLTISASSNRGLVSIEVSDDGRGIDLEAVLRKARDKGLADSARTYAEDEIVSFIFMPGFSTAATIDEISGRGVGLDVVKVELGRLGGKIAVSTTPGRGTRFTLKIPINLAILNGTVITSNDERYIIPTLYINKILNCTGEEWVYVHGKQTMIRMRDRLIPLIEDRSLSHQADNRADSLIVVLEYEQELKALQVQSISDRRDIVVKPLGQEFQDVRCFSGASILGDGKVSLIIDIEALFRREGETW